MAFVPKPRRFRMFFQLAVLGLVVVFGFAVLYAVSTKD